jgi:pimeloyl-ACP methyl ester carboxylesterase
MTIDIAPAARNGNPARSQARDRRRAGRITKALAILTLVLAIVGVGGYSAYVGAVGSAALVHPVPRAQCSTPEQQFGWSYEAINYDPADDARLADRNPDPDNCTDQGLPAGTEVVTSDGIPIAGWYIPAASGAGPAAPTVILVHGWNANKSEVLRYGVALHDRFNLVAFDLRGGGRSGGDTVTFGSAERLDVRAIVDWLVREKRPGAIGLVGNSMGGATAAAAAAEDERITAVLLDSTHASATDVFARRLSVEEGHPPYPGAWALAAGIRLRTGQDPSSADPASVLPRLKDRSVLLIHGSADPIDVPAESAERNLEVARAAGVAIDVRYCPGGGHGNLVEHCPDDWGRWAVEFFSGALGEAGG